MPTFASSSPGRKKRGTDRHALSVSISSSTCSSGSLPEPKAKRPRHCSPPSNSPTAFAGSMPSAHFATSARPSSGARSSQQRQAAQPPPGRAVPLSSTSSASVAVSLSSATHDSRLVHSTRARALCGDPDAMHDLGSFHYRGLHGLKRDKRRGYRWFKKAADAGNVRGMAACGALVLNGAECTREREETTGETEEAGAAAQARGEDARARASSPRDGPPSASEASTSGGSTSPSRQAAAMRHGPGHPPSGRSGQSFRRRRRPHPDHLLEGMVLLGIAAASGSALAAFWLGHCYLEGTYGLPANPARARVWLEKVARDECEVRDLRDSDLRSRAEELLWELDEMEEEGDLDPHEDNKAEDVF